MAKMSTVSRALLGKVARDLTMASVDVKSALVLGSIEQKVARFLEVVKSDESTVDDGNHFFAS